MRSRSNDPHSETLVGPESATRPAAGATGSVALTRSIDQSAAFARHPDHPLPALVAGRYRVGERLGAGAFGVVYKAIDERLQRPVALKILGARAIGHPKALDRFRTEALAAGRLNHPGVVGVSDFHQLEDGVPFLVMEFVEGTTLAAVLEQDPRFSLERAARIARSLCLALDVAHRAGIVHRDLKPANLILRGAGSPGEVVKIVDFGIAKLAAAQTDDEVGAREPLIGTPGYMAPEQVRGDPTTDGRADLYAVGVMLYEMVTGEIPFAHKHAVDVLVAKAVDAPEPPSRHRPELPRQLEEVILRALARVADERFATGAEMAEALAPFVGAPGHGRWRWRWRALALALGAVALGWVAWNMQTGRDARSRGATGEPPKLATTSTPWPKTSSWPPWPDAREGCNCPYSACNGGCVSVCRYSGYTRGATVPGINVVGRQEALLGASGDGETILYLAGPRCALSRLMLARRRGSTFESVDLTDKLDLQKVAIFEGCCTLSADGLTLILSTPDHTHFVRSRVVGAEVLPPEGAEFEDLNPGPTAGKPLHYPVLGADGLTLYYRLDDRVADPADSGPLDGSYVSVRADLQSRFPPGRRLTGKVKLYEYITGVSSDGLSLFLSADNETYVLVRTSTAEPFVMSLHTLTYGWRAVPLADCKRILTTYTPGGCESEDIVYLEALP